MEFKVFLHGCSLLQTGGICANLKKSFIRHKLAYFGFVAAVDCDCLVEVIYCVGFAVLAEPTAPIEVELVVLGCVVLRGLLIETQTQQTDVLVLLQNILLKIGLEFLLKTDQFVAKIQGFHFLHCIDWLHQQIQGLELNKPVDQVIAKCAVDLKHIVRVLLQFIGFGSVVFHKIIVNQIRLYYFYRLKETGTHWIKKINEILELVFLYRLGLLLALDEGKVVHAVGFQHHENRVDLLHLRTHGLDLKLHLLQLLFYVVHLLVVFFNWRFVPPSSRRFVGLAYLFLLIHFPLSFYEIGNDVDLTLFYLLHFRRDNLVHLIHYALRDFRID